LTLTPTFFAKQLIADIQIGSRSPVNDFWCKASKFIKTPGISGVFYFIWLRQWLILRIKIAGAIASDLEESELNGGLPFLENKNIVK
jgi:hypothetical protein